MARFIMLTSSAAVLLASCSAAAPPSLIPAERLPVEIESVEVLQLESFPVQWMLHVSGTLPNPCASPEWNVTEPLAPGEPIAVDLYALPQSNEACIQVLAPFEVNIPLGPQVGVGPTIVLNGEAVPVIQSNPGDPGVLSGQESG